MKKPETRLIHTRKERLGLPTVNPPIERASTVLFKTEARLYGDGPTYGRMGLTVHRELEAALGEVEGARHVRLAANGLQACALAIASVLKAGDHLLFSDSIYGPTRRFCERRLAAMGITATRFPPGIGAGITEYIQDNTAAIMLESPGSLTFEIMDTPAIVTVAKARGIVTIMDNTWGAGLHHQPLALGVDLSLQALTKYVVGHADSFGGAVMTNSSTYAAHIASASEDFGISLGPDDAYMCVRGLRTLKTRLKAHEAAALDMADWLAAHPSVDHVIHPARPDHPDHALWKRDFTGSCGLFGFVMAPTTPDQMNAFLGALQLFGMGFSWGGYESLIIPCDDQLNRQLETTPRAGPLMRVHIGLEATEDLKADLSQAFVALNAVAA